MSTKICQIIEETCLGVRLFRFTAEGKACWLSRSQFEVVFSPERWQRKSCEAIEKQIDEIWSTKLKNSKVYNGRKFRFGKINLINEANVALSLGLTSYKDIIGTSQSVKAGYWLQRGKAETGDSQAYMSDGLGVGILAFTCDGHLILTRRASWTGEYPGLLDRPGGHPEPDNVLQESGLPKSADEDAIKEAVTNEVWKSPVQELMDETGISSQQIEEHTFLGIVANTFLAGRPSLEFHTTVKASAEEVQHQYSLNKHSEADESTSLVLIPPDKLLLLLEMTKQTNQGKIHNDNSTSDVDLNDPSTHQAKDILEESTPALKGALSLLGFIKG